jgi:hypothetical protein
VKLTNKGASTPSSADTIRLTGAAGTVLIGDNNTLTVGEIDIVGGGTLNIDKIPNPGGSIKGGTIVVNGTASGLAATSDLGAGKIDVKAGTLLVNSTMNGSVQITGSATGTIGGTGSILSGVALSEFAVLAPGNLGIGNLTIGGLGGFGGSLAMEVQDLSAYDRLTVVSGSSINLFGTSLTVSFQGTGAHINDVYYIVNNLGPDDVVGDFGVADQGVINLGGGYTARISYDANFNTSFASGGNDIALQLLTIPEPGAAMALLSGLGVLVGFQRFRRRS